MRHVRLHMSRLAPLAALASCLALAALLAGAGSVPSALGAADPPEPGQGQRLSYRLADTIRDRPWAARPGHFQEALDVTATPDGTRYVLDAGSRVHVQAPDGRWIGLIEDPEAIERHGLAWRIDAGDGDRPYLLFGSRDIAIARVGQESFETLFVLPSQEPVQRYEDLAVGREGRIYLARSARVSYESCSERPPGLNPPLYQGSGVEVFAPDGRRLALFGEERLALARRIDVDPEERVFVVNHLASDGACTAMPPTPTPSPTPRPSLDHPAHPAARLAPPGSTALRGLVAFDADGTHRLSVPATRLEDVAAARDEVVALRIPVDFHYVHGVKSEAPSELFVLRADRLEGIGSATPRMRSVELTSDGLLLGTVWSCYFQGLYERAGAASVRLSGTTDAPGLEGPTHPARLAAGDELHVQEGLTVSLGRRRFTRHDAVDSGTVAVQRWPLGVAADGLGQAALGQRGACVGWHGLYRYPLVDIAADGPDLYTALPGRVDLRPDDHLPVLLWGASGTPEEAGERAFVARIDARDGRVALLDTLGGRVDLRSRNGALLSSWRYGEALNLLPTDVAVGPADPRSPTRLYLADAGRNRLLWHEPESGDSGGWPLHDGPVAIATGPDGDVFVLGRGGWGLRYAPTGALRAWWRLPDAELAGQDLTVDETGRVYIGFLALGREYSTYQPIREILEAGIWVFSPEIVEIEPEQEPRIGACLVETDKRAAPARVRLGKEVEVRLEAAGVCPGRTQPAQLAIVVDSSLSMDFRGSLERAVVSLVQIMRTLDPEHVEVALVRFGDGAALELPLGAPLSAVEAALRRLRANGDTRMAAGLDIATTELTGPRAKQGHRKVLLLVSDGVPKDAPMEAADAARLAGIDTYGLILPFERFTQDHETYLQRLVGGPERYLLNPHAGTLDAFARSLTNYRSTPGLLAQATIVDRLPPGMDYVEGSAEPPANWDPDARSLTWELPAVSATEGLALRFRVRPTKPGVWPTNEEATIEYRDATGAEGRLPFPVPSVEVLERPTRDLRIAYLPIAVAESCLAARRPIDLVLVMDVSGSMRGPTRDGRSRLAAAVEAAGLLVDGLDGFDRAGLVTFDARAHMLAPLNFDLRGVRAGLAAAEAGTGTRIDLGIDLARQLMTMAQPRQGARRAILLLTDGLSTSVPHDVAVRQAERARAEGIALHAVSLGDEVDRAAIRRMVGPEGIHRHAPDGADLAGIFGSLAETLPCDPRGFWGARP